MAKKEKKGYDSNKKYVFSKSMDEEEFEREKGKRNSHQIKYKLRAVSEVIKELRTNAETGEIDHTYDKIKSMRTSKDPSKQAVTLHYDRAAKFNSNGKDVLVFQMAGSGFTHFRADYIDHKLKGNISGFSRLMEWLRKIGNSIVSLFSDKPVMTKIQELEEMKFGTGYQVVDKNGTKAEYVRKKETFTEVENPKGKKRVARKVNISIAGTRNMGGSSNSGKYSIHKTRKYIKFIGKKYLKKILREAELNHTDPKNLEIPIVLKSHSRGAVSAIEGAMMLNHWLSQQYGGKYKDCVKFDLIQYDPVPGLGSRHGVNERVNILEEEGKTIEQSGDQMKALGLKAETTVVYGLHDNHSTGFTPQVVNGAKRVIITPFEHSSGFKGKDKKTNDEEHHFRAYIDAETGEAYRNTGLSELPPGVYMVDEMDNLIRMKSKEEVHKAVEKITERIHGRTLLGFNKRQEDRYNVILEAADSCFDRIDMEKKMEQEKAAKSEPEKTEKKDDNFDEIEIEPII
ncbi:MAG: hypothetical protein MR646_11215 [Agathobacter sp.]|nr:hypothetical protein [Agathobacter sp.]